MGESLYVKEAFPDAKLMHFCEYYYRTQGADAGFDPEFPRSPTMPHGSERGMLCTC